MGLSSIIWELSIIIVLCLLIPAFREGVLRAISILWQPIMDYFVKDYIIEKVVCFIVLAGANVLGYYLTKKQKGKVKYIIAGVINLIGLYGIYKI